MRWLWGLPLIPLALCGGICLSGLLVAFVAGRVSARSPERDQAVVSNDEQKVG